MDKPNLDLTSAWCMMVIDSAVNRVNLGRSISHCERALMDIPGPGLLSSGYSLYTVSVLLFVLVVLTCCQLLFKLHTRTFLKPFSCCLGRNLLSKDVQTNTEKSGGDRGNDVCYLSICVMCVA